jgi:uncharacterized membrane protein
MRGAMTIKIILPKMCYYCFANKTKGAFMGEHQEGDFSSAKNMVFSVYILYICTYFTLITAFIGVIIAYVKKDDARESWLKQHFIWQINTFWVTLWVGVIGVITTLAFIGFLVLALLGIWNIYRIVKGLIRYNAQRSPYD